MHFEILRVSGDGYHSFTKIARESDAGEYSCYVDTVVSTDVPYQYITFDVRQGNESLTREDEGFSGKASVQPRNAQKTKTEQMSKK